MRSRCLAGICSAARPWRYSTHAIASAARLHPKPVFLCVSFLLPAGCLAGTAILKLVAFLQYDNHRHAKEWQRVMLGARQGGPPCDAEARALAATALRTSPLCAWLRSHQPAPPDACSCCRRLLLLLQSTCSVTQLTGARS